jgi:hypothetical protein
VSLSRSVTSHLLTMLTGPTCRYYQYIKKESLIAMQELTPYIIKAFFAWLLNQYQGKGRRRVKGLGSKDSISMYYKYFRLAYKRATGRKIFDGNKGLD